LNLHTIWDLTVLTTVIIPNQQYNDAIEKLGKSITAASVGDIIIFGHYEQDNNNSNGKEISNGLF
jgi:hypothetical protein